jgi:hypothetical protein
MVGKSGLNERRKVLGIFGWLFVLAGLVLGSTSFAYAKQPHGRLSDELACSLTNSVSISREHRDTMTRRCSSNEKVNVIVQFVGNDRGDFDSKAAGYGGKSARKLNIVRGQTYSLPMKTDREPWQSTTRSASSPRTALSSQPSTWSRRP